MTIHFTEEKIQEIIKCVPIYPYAQEDEDFRKYRGRGSEFLCSSSIMFKGWWEGFDEIEGNTLEKFAYRKGIISEQEYHHSMQLVETRKAYVKYCLENT